MMKILKYITLFIVATLFLYYYSIYMPKEGLLNSLLYFTVGIPLGVTMIWLTDKLFNQISSRD